MKWYLLVYFTLGFLVLWWMIDWRGQVLPVNLRRENVLELSYLWRLKQSADQGVLWSTWNPLNLAGNTNLLQRGYFLLAPLAEVIRITNWSVEGVYKLVVGAIFVLSGMGMYEYLRRLRLGRLAAIAGGAVYMLLPPHLTLGLDVIDFNFYWALIPWMGVVVENYLRTDKPRLGGAVLGLILALGLITGTTYFIATMPFFGLFFGLRIRLVKPERWRSQIKFVLVCLLFTLGLAAYSILPIVMEYNQMWIAQESQRRNIFNILSFKEIFELFRLRLSGVSVTVWELGRNHPDLAFYLGISVVWLAGAGGVLIRKKKRLLWPLVSLIIIFSGFVGLNLSWVHGLLRLWLELIAGLGVGAKVGIAIIVGLGLVLVRKTWWLLIPIGLGLFIDRFQTVYDHTHRVFILITFGLAILAAYGINWLINLVPKRWRWLAGVGIGLWLIVDLQPFSNYFGFIPIKEFSRGESAYRAVDEGQYQGRYWTPFPYAKHLPKYELEYLNHLISRPRLNNENIYTPFTPRYSTELFDVKLVGGLESGKVDISWWLQLMEQGNVNYVIFRQDVFDYGAIIDRMKGEGWQILAEDGPVVALERQVPVPYVSGAEVISWQRPNPEKVEVEIRTDVPAIVMASEAWYPGWKVMVDGQPEDLLRVNQAFLGVMVDRGEHVVEFAYQQPAYYKIGLLISGVFLMMLLARVANLPANFLEE